MRLTIEAKGHTFVIAMERDKEWVPEPIHPRGDVFATTERADSFDFDDRPPIRIGFASGKGKS